MDIWKKSLSMRDGSGLIGSSGHVPSFLVERCLGMAVFRDSELSFTDDSGQPRERLEVL
jgi:hypothetical protein